MSSLLKSDNSKRQYGGLNNERSRLSQVNDHGIEGTDTLTYIQSQEVQKDRKVTHGNCVCDYKPFKDDKLRVGLIVSGDKLPYELDVGSPAASILETNILANSLISDTGK